RARRSPRARVVGARGVRRPTPARVPRGRAGAARRGAAAGLAAVDGGESYWHARPGGEDRMAMLETEFLPLLKREFGLGGPGRAIAGWPMGGYGALLAAERNPDRWAGVAVASPAIWPAYSDVWRRARRRPSPSVRPGAARRGGLRRRLLADVNHRG